MPATAWERVCQDCWQAINPDQYCPELTDYDECVVCGEFGLTLGVRKGSIEQPASRAGEQA